MAGLRFTQQDYNAGNEQGYYQHIMLTDIITNFMVSETGDGMLAQGTTRTMAEYHAQRAVQELSYDTLRSVKSREYEPEGDTSITLPQDAVDVVGVYWVDDSGYKHPMNERILSGNPDSPLKDDDGNFIYDSNGDFTYATPSMTLNRFDNRTQSVAADAFYNYYAGSFENDELYDRYYSYYGRRFGSEPSQVNINGTYWFDIEDGRVYIDAAYAMELIVLDYVTDGLGDVIGNIRVHKFSEDAIYQYIKWKIVSGKRDMPMNEKTLAKREYVISKKKAKHRLSKISPEEIRQTILNKQKWIKR